MQEIVFHVTFDVTDSEWIKVAQMQDPDLEVIRKILENGDVQPDTKQYFDKFDLRSGVVFRTTESGNKWIVPRAQRINIVKMYHVDREHFAAEKTLDKIKQSYWFSGIIDSVKDTRSK